MECDRAKRSRRDGFDVPRFVSMFDVRAARWLDVYMLCYGGKMPSSPIFHLRSTSLTEYVIPGFWSNEQDLSVVVRPNTSTMLVITALSLFPNLLSSSLAYFCPVILYSWGKDTITNQTRMAIRRAYTSTEAQQSPSIQSNLIWYQIKHMYLQDPDLYLEQHQILLIHRHQRPKYTQSIHYSLRN